MAQLQLFRVLDYCFPIVQLFKCILAESGDWFKASSCPGIVPVKRYRALQFFCYRCPKCAILKDCMKLLRECLSLLEWRRREHWMRLKGPAAGGRDPPPRRTPGIQSCPSPTSAAQNIKMADINRLEISFKLLPDRFQKHSEYSAVCCLLVELQPGQTRTNSLTCEILLR